MTSILSRPLWGFVKQALTEVRALILGGHRYGMAKAMPLRFVLRLSIRTTSGEKHRG
jgi:hypothetical protein